ncbi:MAG: putative toxin-antitoxin system toxin component, PIN family [Roseateles sp.]|uniref:putative toxin-antitoxin system toxin component, PIN family n=1 Tax=Roseateles sp. TaxID=1971397 RepID=UPI0039ECAB20
MTAPVIIDTNVLVAGLLTADAQAPTAQILDGMLAARFAYVVSGELLAEYRDVLCRPKLRELHGLSAEEVETVLTDLALHAIVLTATTAPPSPDPGDQHLWGLLAVRDDLALVTGDARLLASKDWPQRIFSPRQWLDQCPLS